VRQQIAAHRRRRAHELLGAGCVGGRELLQRGHAETTRQCLARREHRHDEGAGALDDAAVGALAIGIAFELAKRAVDVEVLIIEGVRQLVRRDERQHAGWHVGQHVERVVLGRVVAASLFFHQIQEQLLEIGPRRQQPELLVSHRFGAAALARHHRRDAVAKVDLRRRIVDDRDRHRTIELVTPQRLDDTEERLDEQRGAIWGGFLGGGCPFRLRWRGAPGAAGAGRDANDPGSGEQNAAAHASPFHGKSCCVAAAHSSTAPARIDARGDVSRRQSTAARLRATTRRVTVLVPSHRSPRLDRSCRS
jgi:hypothetical protein